jgi:Lectin C-type domain
MSEMKGTWEENREFCATLDSSMVMVKGDEERDFLKWLLPTKKSFWLGGKLSEGNQFQWLDGTPMIHHNFHNLARLGSKIENCNTYAAWFAYDNGQVQWFADNCQSRNNFLCASPREGIVNPNTARNEPEPKISCNQGINIAIAKCFQKFELRQPKCPRQFNIEAEV